MPSHQIVWEGIEVRISHSTEKWHKPFDHIELRADVPLPVTDTGYCSNFIHPDELALFNGVKDFVRQWLNENARLENWAKLDQSKQMEMF